MGLEIKKLRKLRQQNAQGAIFTFRHVHCAKAAYNVEKAYSLLNVEIIENSNPFFYTKGID